MQIPNLLFRTTLLVTILLLALFPRSEATGGGAVSKAMTANEKEVAFANYAENTFASLKGSATMPDEAVFQKALTGFLNLKAANKLKKEILTIVDFSLPSSAKRLWVIDMASGEVLQHTFVAHGQGTGSLYAKKFSNTPDSHQSSLGFYVTSETYHGKHGLSLRLDGVEKGVNCQARTRAIVVHGAEYANPDFIKRTGRLGRSYGCPALPTDVSAEIIGEVQGKSCLFIYAPDEEYEEGSKLLKPTFALGA